jgi:hypothetical protein
MPALLTNHLTTGADPLDLSSSFVALSRGMLYRAALLCGLALLVAGPARAQPESPATVSAPALTWEAPAACPSGDTMERVAELVGLAPEQLATKQLRVKAVVRPIPSGGWQIHLRIETVAGSGERSFAAEDCNSLVRGAALVIALTVDPAAASAHQEAPVPAKAETPTKPTPRPAFLLRPLVAAELGVLPHVAFVYGGALGVTWPRLRFEFDALGQSAQTVSDDQGRSGRVRVPLSSGARACMLWRPSEALEPAACLGAGLAWLRSTGSDIAFPETHDTLAVAITGGPALGWRLRDWLWLRVEAALGVMVRRPKLQVESSSQATDDVYSARWLTVRIGGGLELRL